MLDQILTLPPSEAAHLLADHAAWAWTVENSLLAAHSGAVVVSGGMGVDDQYIVLPAEGEETRAFLTRLRLARQTEYKRWRGFDVRHLHGQGGREFAAFDVFAALEAGAHLLTQDVLDFLTLRDVSGAALEVLLVAGEAGSAGSVEYVMGVERDLVDLTMAFRRQMVEESAPHRHQVAVGAYVLEREPLHVVDTALRYDRLRLVITPGGIFYSLVYRDQYVPGFWSPEGTHTGQVWVTARGLFVLDALLACIWRDACIVRRQFVAEQRGKKGYEGRPRHGNPKVLPRTIYVSTWSSPADRATIREVTRGAHHVSACYPRLQEGHSARDAAERAAEYGWPPPPEGHTFRRPTTRGEGTPQARRVVCRGLQVAMLTLNEKRKFHPPPKD